MEFVRFLFGINTETDYGKTFFSGAGIWIAVIVMALLAGILVVLCLANRRSRFNVTSLAFAAVCIGASVALSYIPVMRMPQGGSVTWASLLPVCLYAYLFGFRRGMLAGLIYSVIQIIQDPYILNLVQVLLDYTLPFTATCLAGLLPRFFQRLAGTGKVGAFLARFDFSLSLVAVGLLKYVFHVLSGVIYFGMFAPAGYTGLTWALLYNLTVFADIAICLVPAILLQLSPQFNAMVASTRRKVAAMDRAAKQPEPEAVPQPEPESAK